MTQTKITITEISTDRTMEIVRALRSMGLIQGKDFNFAFHKRYSSSWNIASYVDFTFYDEKYASWFSLKWGGNVLKMS
jgi:hypothetical protein